MAGYNRQPGSYVCCHKDEKASRTSALPRGQRFPIPWYLRLVKPRRRFHKQPPIRMALTHCISVRPILICVTLLDSPTANIYIWDEYRFNPSRRSIDGLRHSRVGTDESIRCLFAEGEIGGTLGMRSNISVHRATTKYFSNSFIFKNKIEKEGLPRDSPAGLGAGGPEFKSRRPDQKYLPYFLQLIKSGLHPKLHRGIPADRRARSAMIQSRRLAAFGKFDNKEGRSANL